MRGEDKVYLPPLYLINMCLELPVGGGRGWYQKRSYTGDMEENDKDKRLVYGRRVL